MSVAGERAEIPSLAVGGHLLRQSLRGPRCGPGPCAAPFTVGLCVDPVLLGVLVRHEWVLRFKVICIEPVNSSAVCCGELFAVFFLSTEGQKGTLQLDS